MIGKVHNVDFTCFTQTRDATLPSYGDAGDNESLSGGGSREPGGGSWSPAVAVLVWRRMLGSLGDVNRITNPGTHAKVFECLARIMEDLIKVC